MRIDLLLEALPIMGTGYLGIFIVTGVIIGVGTGMIFLFVCKFLHNRDKNENCATIAVIGEEVSSKRSIFKKSYN